MTQTPPKPLGSASPASTSEPENITLKELKPVRLVVVVILWLAMALAVPSISKEFLAITGVLVLVVASLLGGSSR